MCKTFLKTTLPVIAIRGVTHGDQKFQNKDKYKLQNGEIWGKVMSCMVGNTISIFTFAFLDGFCHCSV